MEAEVSALQGWEGVLRSLIFGSEFHTMNTWISPHYEHMDVTTPPASLSPLGRGRKLEILDIPRRWSGGTGFFVLFCFVCLAVCLFVCFG